LGFEGEGEGLPFGEEGEALGAELVEVGGGALGFFGGGEVGERLFGRGDLGFEGGDFLFDRVRRSSSCFCLMGLRRLVGGLRGICG
jgi:hypothetical protein